MTLTAELGTKHHIKVPYIYILSTQLVLPGNALLSNYRDILRHVFKSSGKTFLYSFKGGINALEIISLVQAFWR